MSIRYGKNRNLVYDSLSIYKAPDDGVIVLEKNSVGTMCVHWVVFPYMT